MKKRILAIVACMLVLVAAFALPTFASFTEEEMEEMYDISQYPTMNILPFPYVDFTKVGGGLCWETQEDFGIMVDGEITGYSQFELAEIPLASDTIYTFNLGQTVINCGITAEIILLDSLGGSVSKIYVSLQKSFVTFSTGDYDNVVSARINLLRQSSGLSTNVVDCVIYPMLNVGAEPYPFSPYLPYLLQKNYDNGVNQGYNDGKNAGYYEGFEAGERELYDEYYEDWYVGRYDEGFTNGEQAGYLDGVEDGYANGNADGYKNGRAEGYNLGYSAGEQSEVTKNFTTIIGEIAMAPYTAVSSMFDFEIFGINIAGAICQILTGLVGLIVLGLLFKYVFGG